MGLVNVVVPDASSMPRSIPGASRSCAAPPRACGGKARHERRHRRPYSAVQHGLELVALNHVYGPEPAEGIASFGDKRPADWRKFRAGEGPEPG